jgi:hypothetical protein
MQSYATLALSLVVFALALGVSVVGSRHDSLYIEPGRIDAAPAFKAPPMVRR